MEKTKHCMKNIRAQTKRILKPDRDEEILQQSLLYSDF